MRLLDRPRRVHLLGIGGAGMSAIAEVLVALGHEVSGSDRVDGASLVGLRELGVTVHVGHDAAHLGGADLVGVSTAVDGTNPEIIAARAAGVDVRPRADLLAAIAGQRRTLCISGTHGKTTTSALVVAAASGAAMDPSFLIGGVVAPYSSGARWSAGDWFVLEADESDGSFLVPPRAGAVVTNVEADHLDHYGTFDGLRAAFEQFVAETDGPVVLCADDPEAARLAGFGSDVTTYGTTSIADVVISSVRDEDRGSSWTATGSGWEVNARVEVPGLHVVRNATAALALIVECGADPAAAAAGVAQYRGVGRRFEWRGTAAGITFIDDYAHLPTEIAATLQAARSSQHAKDGARIVVVVQPHRYSRTAMTASQYTDLFAPTDVVVITDVYAAGESPLPGITGETIVDAIRRSSSAPTVWWCAHRHELIDRLAALLRPGDVCLTLGAGDLTTVPDALMARLGES